MENPLDLKLLMNQTSHVTNIGPTIITSNTKAYKCENCNATYTDKMYFDLHKQSHHKELATLVSPKDVPMVQIVQIQGHHQIHPQPTPAHQQHQGHQIIIQEDQVAAYKRAYGVDAQQVYTLAPVTQYQVLSTGGNNRGGTISINNSQQNQVNIPSYSTPTYILSSTPDGHHLQPISEAIIQHEILHDHQDLQSHHEQQVQHMQQEPQIITSHIQQPQHVQITASPSSTSRSNRNVFVTKDRPYKCDQCTASFIDIEELDDHRKKHTGDGPFTCEDCHFTFMYKTHFRSHKTRCQKKRAMNPQAPKTIIVNTSPVKRQFPTFQQQNIKQEAVVQYSTASSPVIQTTKYVTVSSRNNNGTLRLGGKQGPPSKFNPSNPTFKRAKKESRLDRPYECDECDASFQSDVDLKSHKSKHTGEGPFKCDECKFVFLYRKLFEAHRRRCEKKRRGPEGPDPMGIPGSIIPSVHNLSSASTTSNYSSDAVSHISQVQHLHHPQEVQIHSPSISIGVPTSLSSVLSGPIQMHSVSGQPTIIEMRSGHELQQLQMQHPTIIEQVIVAPGTPVSGLSGGRHELKYEMISAGDMIEGVNVNQIMNLIKVKEVNH